MSTTVASAGFEVTSTHESADEMVSALTPKEDSPDPRVLVDKGVPVEKEKTGLSKAASDLGKEGGKAAAKARQAEKKYGGKTVAEMKAAHEAAKSKLAAEARGSDDAPEPEDEPEPEEAEDRDEHPKLGKPRNDPNARVAQAIRRAKEAETEAANARREAADARARLEAAERARTAPAAQDQRQTPQEAARASEKPKEEDFPTYAEFVDALTDWKVDQRAQKDQREYRAHQVAAREAQHVDGLIKGWNGTLEKAAKDDPGFMDAITPALEAIGLPSRLLPSGHEPNALSWIADDLFSAQERAPALLLYLSEQPDEIQRLAALSSPRAITRELAKIENRLDAATTGTSSEREVSKANPPVTPVTGSPAVADGPRFREGMTLDDYGRGWKDPRKR